MSPAGGDLRQRTLQSLFWQFLGVGGQRIVQLCAPIVLWRVLEDRDLGLFVEILAAIGVVEALTTFTGEQTSIWSQRGAERRYIDTVFTVRLLRSLVISGLLCALSGPFAWYFGKPETEARYWLPGLFLALSVNGLIDALQSPARAARMKGLDFRRVALGDFVAALLGVAITIGLALWLRSVWAMVLGHLISTAIRTVASHVVAPPFVTRSSPCSIWVSSGMWPGRTPISPSTVGMTTESMVSEYTFASGVTISSVRAMGDYFLALAAMTSSMPPFM